MSNDLTPHDSISKSLRVLLLLASCESMRVTEISRELDIAASTTHRMLGIMRAQDFVVQEPGSRRYRLGPAALKLGWRTRGDENLLAIGRPHLARLGADLDETVHLVVLDGMEALFVDGVPSGQAECVATLVGVRLPAYATAGGKVLLAQTPYAVLRTQLPDELRRLTRYTVANRAALERELQRARKRGFALDRGEHLEDVMEIGMAINNVHGKPIAAITVAGPRSRWGIRRLKTLAPKLGAAATEISRVLRESGRTV
jgi:DNA-binding IclR family transcriptional regulator